MIQKTINLYTIDELQKESTKGYNKAIQYFRDNNDYMFLSDCMNERLHELLLENNIKDLNDTSKAGTKPTKVLYSLSYSQGDGACFEGSFEYKDITVYIKHTGRYYHSYSVNIYDENRWNRTDFTEAQETANLGYHIEEEEKLYTQEKEFTKLYHSICKELEVYGYDFIEYENSEENIKENCYANEYYFTIDGLMDC